VFRSDPHMATAYSEQGSIGMERQLSTNLSVSANYLYVRGVKLSRTRNVNLQPPLVLTAQNAASLGVPNPDPQQFGRYVFGPNRLDPRFDDIELIEDSASSTYQGLSIAMNLRLANDIEFTAGYTLSRTLDDASDFDEHPQDPYHLRRDWSVSRNSQAQRFVFSGLFDLPFGEAETASRGQLPSARAPSGSRRLDKILAQIQLVPIITLESGRPVNGLTGLDSNRSGAFPLSVRPLVSTATPSAPRLWQMWTSGYSNISRSASTHTWTWSRNSSIFSITQMLSRLILSMEMDLIPCPASPGRRRL
jgi:hypothetical protein